MKTTTEEPTPEEVVTEEEFLAAQDEIKHAFIKRESKLKDLIITYVGEAINPEDPNITVEQIISIFADEFPEFLFVVAQENFLQGYKQGLEDAKLESTDPS